MPKIHHTAVCSSDIDAGLRFWRDGLGFEVLLDETFEGDWPTLLRARSTTLRSIFLGDPTDWSGGILELVDLGASDARAASTGPPPAGFLLVSVFCDVEATLARLAQLGLGGEPRRITNAGVPMAVVHDPDGTAVELIGDVAHDNLADLSGG